MIWDLKYVILNRDKIVSRCGLPNNVKFSEQILGGMFTAIRYFHEGWGGMERTWIARRGIFMWMVRRDSQPGDGRSHVKSFKTRKGLQGPNLGSDL